MDCDPMSTNRLVSYAGNAEDVILMRAFADRPGGAFVDVGAGEPVRGSLTKNLVDRLGWRGVNIEPLPERHGRLRMARPHDANLQVAVGTRPGIATFFRIVPGPERSDEAGLSTLVEGREAEVLASADLRHWRPRPIVVDATVPLSAEPSHRAWEPMVLAAGYRLALFDGLNRFYARDDEPELLRRLSVPANTRDRYLPLACAIRAGIEI